MLLEAVALLKTLDFNRRREQPLVSKRGLGKSELRSPRLAAKAPESGEVDSLLRQLVQANLQPTAV